VISHSGTGQVALIGPPNSGKSALVGALTHAPVTVADYAFATREPVPGMMVFDSIRVQLVDTPPIVAGSLDPELCGLLFRADLAVLVLSAGDPELLGRCERLCLDLKQHDIELVRDPSRERELEVAGDAVKTLVALTGADLPGAADARVLLEDALAGRFDVVHVSSTTGVGLDDFRWGVWRALDRVRVFAKAPGQKPELVEPYYLHAGETVLDFAHKVHRDLATHLKFARLWGEGVHEGQTVQRDHVLHDRDIVELHA
jgi:ribosome-interacting GTPase 1